MQNQNSIELVERNVVSIDEKKAMKPIVPFIDIKTIAELDDETIQQLERACKGGGHSFHHFYHIHRVCMNPDMFAEGQSLYPSIEKRYDYNCVNTMNALAYMMRRLYENYSDNAIFIEAGYSVKESMGEDEKTSYSVNNAYYRVDTKGLAYFMVKNEYKDKVYASEKHQDAKNHSAFYVYDEATGCWKVMKQTQLRNSIQNKVTTILKCVGIPRNEIVRIQRDVFNEMVQLMPVFNDTTDDMLEVFTKAHPNLVQFNDLIYDINSHAVAKAHPRFKLRQVHTYDLPIGELVKDEMVSDGKTFYPLSVTEDEMKRVASLLMERFEVIFKSEQMDFIQTFLGASFYHNVKRFQATLAIRGGGGLGKSFLFDEIVADGMFSGHISALSQGEIDDGNQFTQSSLVGTELNIIGEMKDTVFSKKMIHVLKSVQSGDKVQVEFKGKPAYKTNIYSRTVMIANENQLPTIKTTDVNDSGLKRRMVIIDCKKKQKDDNWTERFDEAELKELIPAFTMLCMMTFKRNTKNGKIRKFHNIGGVSQQAIDGFTTKEIVNVTKAYFNTHDRFRLFFATLPEIFVKENEARKTFDLSDDTYSEYTEATFKKWLSLSKATYIKQLFVNWHNDEYVGQKGKSDLSKYLDNYDIKPKSVKVNGKVVKAFGESFSEMVFNICLEDDPEGLWLNLNDMQF